jgi:hypothetical protein
MRRQYVIGLFLCSAASGLGVALAAACAVGAGMRQSSHDDRIPACISWYEEG